MIRLTGNFTDYDVYKNDKGNIARSELPWIEETITQAKIGDAFEDWTSFAREAFALKVPGYGAGGGHPLVSGDREFLTGFVEIPMLPPEEKFRFFVLRRLPDGKLRLVDDFILSRHPDLLEVSVVDHALVYVAQDGRTVREKKL